jgi:hypothetical protein
MKKGTAQRIAKIASRVLDNPASSTSAKLVAASASTQVRLRVRKPLPECVASHTSKTTDLGKTQVQIDNPTSIWFTHNRSPALKPNAPSTTTHSDFNNFSAALRNEFARSVAIVSTDGIEEFMSWNLEEWLGELVVA